jgi:hypothetical protein
VSLIGDALRRARQEAAERESDRKGILFSAKIAEGPTRSNLGLGLAIGALIAVIATVAGGAAVWWILGVGGSDRDQRPVAATETATEAGAPAIVEPASASASVSDPDPDPVPVPEGSDSNSDQRQPSAAATGTATEPTSAPESNDNDSDSGSSGGSNRATDDPTTSGPESGFLGTENGEEIYILEADLGDVSLSLDFLIYREVDPFAEINGVEVHLGGTIEGYRVKAIERDRVSLSNGRRTIVLRAP